MCAVRVILGEIQMENQILLPSGLNLHEIMACKVLSHILPGPQAVVENLSCHNFVQLCTLCCKIMEFDAELYTVGRAISRDIL